MKNLNWKRFIGIGLAIFTLSLGSVGLVGCEFPTEEAPLEQEELEEEDDD